MACPVMPHTTMVLGGPGCGKTTRLLNIVEQEIASGIPARQIAFVAFTKAAAEEAIARAAEKFKLDPKRDLPYFRTIHSLAYQQLGITRDRVMQGSDWRRVGDMIGERISMTTRDPDGTLVSSSKGDRMLMMYDLSRVTRRPLLDVLAASDEEVSPFEMDRFVAAVTNYKTEKNKLDFTDMLLEYANAPLPPVPVAVAVVDEAQDLTAAQWAVVDRAFRDVKRLYIGGDDDQAIYRWAGADVDRFLTQEANERIVLPLSHRLPERIFAVGQSIAHRITQRYEKPYAPARPGGEVHYHQRWLDVPLEQDGSWLVLARNSYMLKEIDSYLRAMGWLFEGRWGPSAKPEDVSAIYGWERWRKGELITGDAVKAINEALGVNWKVSPARKYEAKDFSLSPPTMPIWHEALSQIPFDQRMYYVSALRRGQKLNATPRIRLETIHSVKGAEADHVAVAQDMSARTFAGYEKDADTEHRVFYVAVTRAKQSLHVVSPQSQLHYTI